ncbi:MAG: AbrB/MazE/SpoVT family DNA-binding domain-containing protein [Solirubrobacterales bacterium]
MAPKVKNKGSTARKRVQNKRERGTSTISSKNQISLPADALRAVGFTPGDRVEISPGPGGTLVISIAGESRADRIKRGAGVFSGLYPPNYLDKLREGDW